MQEGARGILRGLVLSSPSRAVKLLEALSEGTVENALHALDFITDYVRTARPHSLEQLALVSAPSSARV